MATRNFIRVYQLFYGIDGVSRLQALAIRSRATPASLPSLRQDQPRKLTLTESAMVRYLVCVVHWRHLNTPPVNPVAIQQVGVRAPGKQRLLFLGRYQGSSSLANRRGLMEVTPALFCKYRDHISKMTGYKKSRGKSLVAKCRTAWYIPPDNRKLRMIYQS